MKRGLCVYPGSFDPVTSGHLDIIERASKLFPHVVVAVLNNPDKRGCFPIQQRMAWLKTVCGKLDNVEVDCFDGLLMDYMKRRDAEMVIRGLRAVTDFESEFQMAQLNRALAPRVETLFLMTAPENACVSSSAVRQISSFGGDIGTFVPGEISSELKQAFAAINGK